MFLNKEVFKTVVGSTPLISIDLVVRNPLGDILLGKRNNRPAQGYWFVPGGRIMKGEAMNAAFSRLCKEELGLCSDIKAANFLGPFEHFYEDSIFGSAVSTHYVVLGYEIEAEISLANLPNSQHHEYDWFSIEEMAKAENVHRHSKWYLEALK